ncbi:MAG: MarR family transcriptional regulator [Pseudomonadota bacterium]
MDGGDARLSGGRGPDGDAARDPSQERLSHLVAAANRRLEDGLAARLRQAGGCAIEQFRILEALARRGSLTMGALAEAALVERPTLTKIVDRMSAAGLVARSPDAVDRRRVNLTATEAGRALHRRLEGAAAAQEAELAERLSGPDAVADPATARALLQALAGAPEARPLRRGAGARRAPAGSGEDHSAA